MLIVDKIAEMRKNVKISHIPLPKKGQMTCGKITGGIQIEWEDEKLIVSSDKYLSQMKNRNLCLKMLEFYITIEYSEDV